MPDIVQPGRFFMTSRAVIFEQNKQFATLLDIFSLGWKTGMLERCSGIMNSQELPEQPSGVQKMSSSVAVCYSSMLQSIKYLDMKRYSMIRLHPILSLLLCLAGLFSTGVSAQILPPRYNLEPIGHLSYAPLSLAGCWHHVDHTGGEWALVGTSAGMSIVDLSDPTQPVERFTVPGLSNNWRELRSWNGYAYVGSEASGSGITIVNLNTLPDSVSWKVWMGDGIYDSLLVRSHTVQAQEAYLYVFGGGDVTNGCTIASLSDPWNPEIIGRYTDNYVHDGFIRNDTLWTSEIYKGWFGVVDISDRSNPQLLTTQPTPGAFNHNCELSPDSKTLFSTDEKPNTPLGAFDVSDLENITLLDTYFPGRIPSGEVHNVRVKGQFLVNPSYRGQLTIVDASQPDNLIETAWDSLGNSLVWDADPYLPSGLLFATAKSEGLFVYQPVYHLAARLEGQVFDATTGFPISNAVVEILTTTNKDLTNQEGIYKTGAAAAGIYQVSANREGYESVLLPGVILNAGQTTLLNISLQPIATSAPNIDREEDIQVTPTLFSSFLQVQIPPDSPYASADTRIRMIHENGQKVTESQVVGNTCILSHLEHLPAGHYYLILWNGASCSNAIKVVKQY